MAAGCIQKALQYCCLLLAQDQPQHSRGQGYAVLLGVALHFALLVIKLEFCVWLTAHPILLRVQTLDQQVLCMLLRKLSIIEEMLSGKVKQLCQALPTASSLACLNQGHVSGNHSATLCRLAT